MELWREKLRKISVALKDRLGSVLVSDCWLSPVLFPAGSLVLWVVITIFIPAFIPLLLAVMEPWGEQALPFSPGTSGISDDALGPLHSSSVFLFILYSLLWTIPNTYKSRRNRRMNPMCLSSGSETPTIRFHPHSFPSLLCAARSKSQMYRCLYKYFSTPLKGNDSS